MKQTLSGLYLRFKSAPKFVRVSTYLSLAYAGYAITLGLITPAVLEAQAPKQLTELLGRQVTINKISINPFLLRTRVQGFSVAEQDNEHTFTQFELLELEVNFWRSLLTFTPTIDHLTLNAPQIQINRISAGTEAKFNFSDIVGQLEKNSQNSSQESPSNTEDDAQIPSLRVNQIHINSGEFKFADAVTNANLGYQNINLELTNVDSRAYTLSLPANNPEQKLKLTDSANKYALSLQGSDQSQLSLNGQFQLPELEVAGDIALNSLGLTSYWPFAKDQIQAQLTNGQVSFNAQYHAKQTADHLSYQASEGHFELNNLIFNDKNTEKVKLPALTVDGINVSGDQQTVEIADISMQGLWADAVFNDSGLDLATLFTPVSDQNTSPKANSVNTASETSDTATSQSSESSQAPGWKVTLNRFAMNDSDLNVLEKQQSQGVHWRVYPMSVTTGAINSDLVDPIDYDVELAVSSSTRQQPEKARGSIATSGQVDVNALNIEGDLTIKALDLSQIQPYLKSYLNVQLSKGALSTQGQYRVNGAEDITFDGSASIVNLLMKDNIEREPLIKWKELSIDSLRFGSLKNQLFIKTVALNEPYAKVTITKDQHTNIGDLVVTNESKDNNPESNSSEPQTHKATVTTKSGSSKPMSVVIEQIKFSNGSAFFADNSLTPNFASGIEFLEGSIKHLSSTPGTKATVDIEGKVDKYAPVTLKGEINPLIENPYLQLALAFKSIELTSVNPYSGTYAGYYIDKGQLSLDLNYQLDNNQLHGNNHVVVDQLQLGKPSDSSLATSLPITLAIAILQDRHGVIDLGVEVSGEVDDPEFSFGSVILKAFVNVITKAVTAPFSLLADLVGSEDELNQISFPSGLAILDEEQKQRITQLAKALDERPILKVNVEGSVLLPDDSAAIANQQVQEALLMISGLEALPEPFSASRIAESKPLSRAIEALAEKQLQIDLGSEKEKVTQKLTEESQGTEVTEEQIDTTLHMGLYNQLVNSTEVSKNTLSNLAAARAKAIKALLVDEFNISPDRVFLLDSKTDLKTDNSGAELTVTAE